MSPIFKSRFDKSSGWRSTKWLSGWISFALVGLLGVMIFLTFLIAFIEAILP